MKAQPKLDRFTILKTEDGRKGEFHLINRPVKKYYEV